MTLVSFAALPLNTLLGAFAGVAALTIGLYVLKLRRRRVAVPFLELWEKLLLERKASAWRSRLQRLLSLLLSLCLVGALILALGDPRSDSEQEGRSIVILVDASASMKNLDQDGKSRIQLAREQVREWFPSFVGGDEVLLVEMGARPRPLDAFTGDVEKLDDSLEALKALDVSADAAAALALAQDALRGRKRAEIIFVSDGAVPAFAASQEDQPKISFAQVGESSTEGEGENVAIVAFSARRYPLSGDRFEVLLEVENSGEQPAEVEISLHLATDQGGEGSLVEMKRLTLPAGDRYFRSFENLAQAEEGLIAKVRRVDGVQDPFAADDIARTLLSPRVPVRVLVVGEPNTFLDAALLIEESLQVKRVSAAEYPPAGDFDVTLFDGVFPERVARTGAAVYLGVPADDEKYYPVEIADPIESFGFDTWKKDSTVFRLIDPYDVQVLSGVSFKPQPSDTSLGASEGRPILVQGEREAGKFLALGFAPTNSDLVLRAVWPLFVVNLIDELFPRGRGEALLGLKTGQVWRPPVPGEGEPKVAEIVGPLGQGDVISRSVPVEGGRAVFFGQEAGFYEVKNGDASLRFSASLLQAGEARLRATDELMQGDQKIAEVSGMDPRPTGDPWFWLLVGVFSISFIEWWTFHRRWTV